MVNLDAIMIMSVTSCSRDSCIVYLPKMSDSIYTLPLTTLAIDGMDFPPFWGKTLQSVFDDIRGWRCLQIAKLFGRLECCLSEVQELHMLIPFQDK